MATMPPSYPPAVAVSLHALLGRLLDTPTFERAMPRLLESNASRSRHALYRLLRREQLPSLRQLKGAARVLLWMEAWNEQGRSLAAQALAAGAVPASYYRTVWRVTGRRWREIRTLTREEVLSLALHRRGRRGEDQPVGE